MRYLYGLLALCLGGYLYNNPDIFQRHFSFKHVRHVAASMASDQSESQQPAVMVELYSYSYCQYCKAMASDLRQAGIPFTEYYVDTNPPDHDRMINRMAKVRAMHFKGLPMVFVGDQIFYGYSSNSISEIQTAMQN